MKSANKTRKIGGGLLSSIKKKLTIFSPRYDASNLNDGVSYQPPTEMFPPLACSTHGDCFEIGEYSDMILEYFNQMDFKWAVDSNDSIMKIGATSQNGFVNQIAFKKDIYSAYAVLKSSIDPRSDNLFYEYVVGKNFINKYNRIYPCFLTTYKLLKYNNEQVYIAAKTNDTRPLKNNPPRNKFAAAMLINGMIETNNVFDGEIYDMTNMVDYIDTSCIDVLYQALLIQHFKKPQTLTQFIKINMFDRSFFVITLLTIFMQIYIPLGQLETKFTHNDLHFDNILIIQVPNNRYITLTYKLPTGDISFKTKYICKIIDYGRSYFNEDVQNNSTNWRKQMCQTTKCGKGCSTEQTEICETNPKSNNICGVQSGYSWANTAINDSNYYISTIINNPGKDLWMILMLHKIIPASAYRPMAKIDLPSEIVNNTDIDTTIAKCNHLIEINKTLTLGIFGSANDPETGAANPSKRSWSAVPPKNADMSRDMIYTVSGFSKKLVDIFIQNEPDIQSLNDILIFNRRVKYGTLTIFSDMETDMKFTPENNSTQLGGKISRQRRSTAKHITKKNRTLKKKRMCKTKKYR